MSGAAEEIESQLGAVFDELVELIGETKQAIWTASSSERRQTFDNLKTFVAEQVVMIDDATTRTSRTDRHRDVTVGHRDRVPGCFPGVRDTPGLQDRWHRS